MFLVDGKDAHEERTRGNKATCCDDCGVYNNFTLKSAYYIREAAGKVSYMEKRNVYVSGKKRKPLEPQPLESKVFILKRYYCS